MLEVCTLTSLWGASPFVLSADGLSVYDTVNNITWLADADLPSSNRFGMEDCNGSGLAQKTCSTRAAP